MRTHAVCLAIALVAASAPGVAEEPDAHVHGEALAGEAPLADRSVYQLSGAFTDAQGRPFRLAELRGKPVLALLFYGTCQSACPILVRDLQRIDAELSPAERQGIRYLLVSFDPGVDTPERLAAYAKEHDLEGARWTLLNGAPDQVRELAAVLGVRYRATGDGQYSHTQRIALLDRDGVLAETFDGLDRPLDPIVARARQEIARDAQSSASPVATPAPSELSIPRLEVDGPFESRIRLEVSNRIRGEFVDWFATSETGPTPDNQYDFLGNKFQAGIRVTRDPIEAFLQFEDATLTNLPSRGIGVGASYYANTGYSPQNGAFIRNGWLKWKRPLGLDELTVTGGRQLYSDGMDAPAKDPTLAWVQANRIGQRLLGPFDYTHVGRSFDGGKLAFDTDDLNLTGFGFVPTRGGFEVHANGDMNIVVAGGALNLKDSPAVMESVGRTIARLFYVYYQDDRDLVFLDNRPLAQRKADKGRAARIHSIGASAVHVEPLGPGNVDLMAYGFAQVGAWQSQEQDSYAWGTEAGYQLADVFSKPWLRLGFNLGSGDKDPTDGTHATFFQLLPTAWLYAQFPFYNMMNDQDAFAQLVLQPHPRVTLRWDMLHWLRTTSSLDLAYFGGGATKDTFFGYGSTGASKGHNELALLTHLLLTVKPIDPLTLSFFYAHAWGQGVIGANFTGRPADYGFVEATLSF